MQTILKTGDGRESEKQFGLVIDLPAHPALNGRVVEAWTTREAAEYRCSLMGARTGIIIDRTRQHYSEALYLIIRKPMLILPSVRGSR